MYADYNNNFDPTTVNDWSIVDQSTIPPSQINSIPPSDVDITKLDSTQRQQLTADQLSSVIGRGGDLGDLGQYNSANLKTGLQAAGYNINNLQGDLSGTKIEGNSLVLSDGSSYDLKSGRPSICLFLSPTHSK